MLRLVSDDSGNAVSNFERTHVIAGLIDAEARIFEIKAERIDTIAAVFDRGIELPIERDEPNIRALRAAHIKLGYARTCRAAKRIRVGAEACEPITAEVSGAGLTTFVFQHSDLAGGVTEARKAHLKRSGWLLANERGQR